jgi:hypothetical protein
MKQTITVHRMEAENTLLRLKLMLNEALKRLNDAKFLQKCDPLHLETENSDYLLELLALELLLKFIYQIELHDNPRKHRHGYLTMFEKLPNDVRDRLLALAGERIGPSALVTDYKSVLTEWESNFIDLRYPYEKYEGLNEKQYLERGNSWASRGAPMDEATFRYHPQELHGLLFALECLATEHAVRLFGEDWR